MFAYFHSKFFIVSAATCGIFFSLYIYIYLKYRYLVGTDFSDMAGRRVGHTKVCTHSSTPSNFFFFSFEKEHRTISLMVLQATRTSQLRFTRIDTYILYIPLY